MDLQKLLDTMSETSRVTRGNYHLTLGKLMEAMDGCGDELVAFDIGGSPTKPHSYRGYYSAYLSRATLKQ